MAISDVAPAALKPCDQHVVARNKSPGSSPPVPDFETLGAGKFLGGFSMFIENGTGYSNTINLDEANIGLNLHSKVL